jgi:hypothetical protein
MRHTIAQWTLEVQDLKTSRRLQVVHSKVSVAVKCPALR